MFDEFKKFAMRGNVVDLAVGGIIGAAFGANRAGQIGRNQIAVRTSSAAAVYANLTRTPRGGLGLKQI